MRKILLKVIIFCLLGVAAFFLVFSLASAEVKVGDNFEKEYDNFIKTLPIPETFVTDKSFQNIPAYHMPPISRYDIKVTGNQQIYKSGSSVKLTGELTYTNKSEELEKTVRDACREKVKDKTKCNFNTIYQVPAVNDLNIFAQVWRKDLNSKKGDFLVDEQYVLENADLTNGKSELFNFTWKIPQNSDKGNYYVSFYVNATKKLELNGTPVAQFKEAERFDFQVTSDKKGISLDKENIDINDVKYSYRSPAPSVEKGTVNIKIPLVNRGTEGEQVNVKYELFRWSQADESDIINTKEEIKTVAAGGKVDLTYTVNPNNIDSVYNLRITANTLGSNSVSNIRFLIKDSNRGIFRGLGVLSDGSKYIPYFCIRNAQWDGVFNGKVKISILDTNKNVLGTHEEKARIHPEEACFSANNIDNAITAGSIIVKGEIMNENSKVVDTAEVDYDTTKIVKKGEKQLISEVQKDNKIFLYIITTIIILLIGGGIILLNTKKTKNE